MMSSEVRGDGGGGGGRKGGEGRGREGKGEEGRVKGEGVRRTDFLAVTSVSWLGV